METMKKGEKMKVSNFRALQIQDGQFLSERKYTAKIDVTTGFFKKKTAAEKIMKEFIGSWIFVKDGTYTPDIVNNLEKVYRVQNNIKETLL